MNEWKLPSSKVRIILWRQTVLKTSYEIPQSYGSLKFTNFFYCWEPHGILGGRTFFLDSTVCDSHSFRDFRPSVPPLHSYNLTSNTNRERFTKLWKFLLTNIKVYMINECLFSYLWSFTTKPFVPIDEYARQSVESKSVVLWNAPHYHLLFCKTFPISTACCELLYFEHTFKVFFKRNTIDHIGTSSSRFPISLPIFIWRFITYYGLQKV